MVEKGREKRKAAVPQPAEQTEGTSKRQQELAEQVHSPRDMEANT